MMGSDGKKLILAIGQSIKFLGTRVATVYLAVFFVFFVLVDLSEPVKIAHFRVLNRIKPEFFNHLTQLMGKEEAFDPLKIKQYVHYFDKVSEYVPDKAAAPAMLGYTYYYAGRRDQAIEQYKESVKRNPVFFWSQYNLGLLYFKAGRYEEAIESLQEAVATKPDLSLVILYTSKVYGDIVNESGISRSQIIARFREGYRNAQRLLVLSYFARGEHQKMFLEAIKAIRSQQDQHGFFYYYAGLGAYELKNYSGAASYLKVCLDRDPQNKEAVYYMGLALKEIGQIAMSEAVLRNHAKLPDRMDMITLMKGELTLQIF